MLPDELFLIERRPGSALHLLSIADLFACTESAQSRSSSMPGFRGNSWDK